MSTPRARPRATTSEWPQLSLLTVYSDEPLLDATEQGVRLDDAVLEAARVLYFNTPLETEDLDATRRNRIMGTITGVQGFARTLAPTGSPNLRAVHSTRRRMVWYGAEPGFYVHATVQLPKSSRRSRSASSATADSATAGTANPPPDVEDEYLIAALQQGHRRFRLRHGTLAQNLQQDGKTALLDKIERHWDGWLRRFDLFSKRSLEEVVHGVPHSSLLTPSTKSQLRPLLTQFAASNASALPILLHGRDVLALPKLPENDASTVREPGRPPPPALQEDELVDLVRYLANLVPKSTVLAVHHSESPSAPATKTSTASVVSNAWSSSLSSLANGMSFLSPRPLSLSLASLPTADKSQESKQVSNKPTPKNLRAGFAALRQQEKAALAASSQDQATAPSPPASGVDHDSSRGDDNGGDGRDTDSGWSFRSVSWSKLGFGGNSAATAAKSAAEVAVNREEASVPPATSSSADNTTLTSDTDEVAVIAREVSTELPADGPGTPQVELAPAVDAEELAAAIGQTPDQEDRQLQLVEVRHEATANGEGQASASEEDDLQAPEKVLEIYVGGAEASRCHVRRYTRGLLTLALAVRPSTDEAATAWLDSRADRLLEAVETMTELVQPPKAVYPHRHIVKYGAIVASVDGSRAGNDAAEGVANEAESEAALLESYRAVHSSPTILESLTRLSSARWALHRQHRSLSAAPSVSESRTRDIYAVAPSKNARGRELSLVDAADELRRIERAYEKW
ncbi:hypothetical protein JCM10908_005825 [Rhodotorula pacifica]|uniref:uncharacterized protein n=1 Tax=Rhodotorula pacifica TaxID=1495444 RepID=UPI0031713546